MLSQKYCLICKEHANNISLNEISLFIYSLVASFYSVFIYFFSNKISPLKFTSCVKLHFIMYSFFYFFFQMKSHYSYIH